MTRDAADLTVDAAVGGQLTRADLRMSRTALEHQASLAEADGNPQLGANLRRAAEIVDLPDEEVLAIYEALRPSRSTATELGRLARGLDDRGAVLCAALVREASDAYVRRGLST